MTPLGYLAAFLCAIPAGAGIGGGGLFIIYLVSAGFSQIESGALNLIFFISAATCSLPYHFRRRNINFKFIIISAIAGIIGTLLGGWIRGIISEEYLRLFFGVMLIFTGLRSLFRKKITNFHDFPSTNA